MKKVILICAMFMFAAVNYCSAQVEDADSQSVETLVEDQTPVLQVPSELEKMEAEFDMIENVIKQTQEKQLQKREELQKQAEAGLISEEELKKAEEELQQMEEGFKKTRDEFRKQMEQRRTEVESREADK